MKRIFKGAATTVITQRTKDPIYLRYERLVDGGAKLNLANLSLARMIAATVLRMWKEEERIVALPMLWQSPEVQVSTRDRQAESRADARIGESAAGGEVCLALRPYGRVFKLRWAISGSIS